MKVTVIMKDLSEQFYNGFGQSIPAFLVLSDADKFEKLRIMAGEKRVTMKIESGQFRDAVELNSLRKKPHSISFKIEPRKGYKLATFEIVAQQQQRRDDSRITKGVDKMTIEKTIYGYWKISKLINGQLVTRQYSGYSKRDAIAMFKEDTRG